MGEEPEMRVVISPTEYDAAIFDMDGVVTDTARVHRGAWRLMFDDYLAKAAERTGDPFVSFTDEDYLRYVDGKPRFDGTKSFLESRDVHLPDGGSDDPPGRETIWGLSAEKNRLFLKALRETGADAYETTLRLIEDLRSVGIKTGIITGIKTQQNYSIAGAVLI